MAFESELEQLYREKRTYFVFLFGKWGHPPDLAEELAQQTFLQAHKSLPTFQGKALLSSYVYSIAQNISKNAIRCQNTQKRKGLEMAIDQNFETQQVVDDADNPEQHLLTKETKDLLAQSLDQLPTKMRFCVELFYLRGFRAKDIAGVLKVAETTVKTHLQQGKKRLAHLLGGDI